MRLTSSDLISRSHLEVSYKTVRIEIKGTEFGGPFSYNRADRVFFRASARKMKNSFLSHGTGAIQWASTAMVFSFACGPSAPVLLDCAY